MRSSQLTTTAIRESAAPASRTNAIVPAIRSPATQGLRSRRLLSLPGRSTQSVPTMAVASKTTRTIGHTGANSLNDGKRPMFSAQKP